MCIVLNTMAFPGMRYSVVKMVPIMILPGIEHAENENLYEFLEINE